MTENSCAHCGTDCGKMPIVADDKIFCCIGCQAVWQILNQNKLFSYYTLEKTPGIRVDEVEPESKYSFLDNDEIASKLITFADGEINKVKFYIPVMHCSSCIWLLEHINSLHSGIKYSAVNFVKKEVDITFNNSEISIRQLVELLNSIHYIPDLSQSRTDKIDENKPYKQLLYKIGVAGFVFINVMTYSLPAYFNGTPLSGRLGAIFAILSYILVIPVVFYSANDYFISAYKNLKNKNISLDLPIAIGVFVLFAFTSYEVISGNGGGYSDSLAGLIFFLLVGRWYQSKSYEALSFERNYKSYFPIAVTKINKQVEETVLLENIVPTDEIIIRNKELIPADAILIEGTGVIDYSFVTGESTPSIKNVGDFIYAGGRQMGGIIHICVEKAVNQSHLTKLWNQDKSYEKPSTLLKNITDKVGQNFTIALIIIAFAGFLGWALVGKLHTAIFVFTSVLIIACPCALSLSIPFTFGNTMRIFGRKGLYIKNSEVVEKLSRIDTIVFDKTGTLTKPNETNCQFIGNQLSEVQKCAIHSLAKQSPHPLSIAVAKYFENNNYASPQHFVEIQGEGIYGKVGDLELKIGSEKFVDNNNVSVEAKSSIVYISIQNSVVGVVEISNSYRENIENVIFELQKKHQLFLLSGDNDGETQNLQKYFGKENLFFNQKPKDKAYFIEKLQHQNKNVLMTGDGLNDAGALMQADVALSVANKVYQFSPASDAVIEADKFSLLPKFIAFASTSISIVYFSFAISLFYNIIGVTIALCGMLTPVIAAILMPISSVSVVAFATFATRIAAKRKLR